MKRIFFALILGVCSFASAINSIELPWMNAGEEGAIYRSSDHPGAVFVIEAYFLNCPYCNENAPNINALQKAYSGNDKVQILDVGIDKFDSQYERWIEKHDPNHPVLKDAKRAVIRQLGTSGYPTTYVLDQNLNVVFKNSGVLEEQDAQRLKGVIDRRLAE